MIGEYFGALMFIGLIMALFVIMWVMVDSFTETLIHIWKRYRGAKE